MFPNRLAFTALGLACLVAAAGGGYLATRQNAVSVAVPAASAAPTAPATSAAPVQAPEAVVASGTKVGSPATQPQAEANPGSAPSKRSAPAHSATRPTKAPEITARGERPPPTVERGRPNGGVSTPAPSAASVAAQPADSSVPPAHAEEHAADVPRVLEPPERAFEELVVSANSVIGLQTDVAINSDYARVEDRVEGRVARDVRVGGQVAIPAGTRASGSVVVVDRGGKFKERARLGIRFHALTMADGTEVRISTETIYRYGEGPGNSSAAKIGGGAVAGAILGAIIGGGKGAAVGATTGAGAGTVAVAAGDRSVATFPAGAEVTARILSPVTFTIEK